MYPHIGQHIGGYTGRIGMLGPYNMVGAPALMMPGMMPGMMPPGGLRPGMPGLAPHGMAVPMGWGAPQGGMMGGPVPDMAMAYNPNQGAYVLILPIPSTGSLAAAASATVSIQPQRPMRLERLATTATAAQFTITLAAGVDNQFIGAGAVDAAIFAAGAFGVAIRGSTVYPGITISMIVTNISGGALTAQGWAFIGSAVA